MSTYEHRRQQIADLHAAADRLYPDAGDSWRDARRAAVLVVLLDAAGISDSDTDPPTVSLQRVADLLDQVDPADQRTLGWLADIGDPAAVAGVAALLDHARS